MKTILPAFLFAFMLSTTTFAAEKDARCYELRTYYAAPGKLDDLQARFRDHTMKIFEKHNMMNIGYWVPMDNPDNQLIYVLAFPSREAHDQAWKEFGGDPEWKEVSKRSEANGRLGTKVESLLMSATDYSPEINPSTAGAPRVFELRKYTASSGNLGALDDRFCHHTVGLFRKHGMQQIAYWHLLPD